MGHVAGFTPYRAGLSLTSRPVRGPEFLEGMGPTPGGAGGGSYRRDRPPCCCGGDVEALKMGTGWG